MGSESIAHEAPPSRRCLQVRKPFLTLRSLMIPYNQITSCAVPILQCKRAIYKKYNAWELPEVFNNQGFLLYGCRESFL